MNQKYPRDRFDDIPASLDRKGAHRAPRTPADRLASWLWALGAIVALVGVGAIGIFVIDRLVAFDGNEAATSETPAATESAAETVVPEVVAQRDPEIPVTVLNGTQISGVAGRTSDALSALDWNVVTIDDAATDDHTQTQIIYGSASEEAAALALVQDLGGGAPSLDPAQAQPGTITIIVGTDLAG